MNRTAKAVNMKTILTALTLACLLTGCANLGTMFQPRDPNIASAEASASSAEKWVSTFLQFVQANPQLGLGEKAAAENLARSFDPDLRNLYGTLALYQKNPMANQQPLQDAIMRVRAHEEVAKRFMNGPELRGQGAPFAPPMGSMPPGPERTIVVNQQDQIVQEIRALKDTVARIGHMVWTNQQARATNAVKEPAIPGK